MKKLSEDELYKIIIDIVPGKLGEYKKEKFKQIEINNEYFPYLISSYGRVFRIHLKNNKYVLNELKPRVRQNGYLEVTLSSNNVQHYMLVHRLVGLMFVKNDNPKLKTQINHINSYKIDNHYWNLEWCTPKENIKHMFDNNLKHIRKGEEINFNINPEHSVIKACELITENIPYKEISKITGIKYDMLRSIYKKKAWKHIVANYDFSNYNYGKSKEDTIEKQQKIIKVCEMLESNRYSMKEISNLTGIGYGIVNKIRNREIYKEISSNYEFGTFTRKTK